MKTTLNIRDDLYRRAKAKAALQGKSLGRYLEDALERELNDKESNEVSFSEWAAELPAISEQAREDLEEVFEAADFRSVDRDMWE